MNVLNGNIVLLGNFFRSIWHICINFAKYHVYGINQSQPLSLSIEYSIRKRLMCFFAEFKIIY